MPELCLWCHGPLEADGYCPDCEMFEKDMENEEEDYLQPEDMKDLDFEKEQAQYYNTDILNGPGNPFEVAENEAIESTEDLDRDPDSEE
jgi:hypothetical protein